MANIMLNEVCNLQCPYCFANKYVNGKTDTEISYKNFKRAVDWVNASTEFMDDVPRIGIIGGEPTLHSQFLDLLDYAVRERLPNQDILVFTNGLKIKDSFGSSKEKDFASHFARNNISLLINLNSPKDIGEVRYKKITDNIREMRLKGVSVSIGINFYKPDLDLSFVYEIIEELSLKDLRVGMCAPNTKCKIDEGSFKMFNEIKAPLITLAKEAAIRGCGIHLDCQKVPRCIMEDSIGYIRKLEEENGVAIDIMDNASCTPVIDILPDLMLARCFGVSGEGTTVPMESFANEVDAMNFFRTNIDNLGYLIRPKEEKCFSCYDRNIGYCQAGCLAYKYEDIAKLNKAEVTPRNANI